MTNGLNFSIPLLGAEAYSERFNAHTKNLGAAGAVAGRTDETFITSFETTSQISGVESFTVRHLDAVGLPVSSEFPTHFSISGAGFAPVKYLASGGNLGWTRDCTFKPDADLNFVNNHGEFLQVFLVNEDGTPKLADVTSTTNLTTLNVRGLTLSPVASTNVGLSLQLPSSDTIASSSRSVPVPVIDSLGVIRNLNFNWKRVDATDGAGTASVYTHPSATQAWRLTITSSETGVTVGAPYATGCRIEFDSSGNPLRFGTQGNPTTGAATVAGTATPPSLSVTWGAPAAASTIALALGDVGSNSGVISTGKDFTPKSITKDGSEPGIFHHIEFDQNGFGTVTYSNDARVKYCRIPLATFNNINGLSEVRSSVFSPTSSSGTYLLYFPKEGGTDALVAGTYEGSATNSTAVYIKMIEDQKRFVGNLKAIETMHKMLDRLEQI